MSVLTFQAGVSAVCRHCGGGQLRVSWQTFQDGRRHVRAECPRCDRFVAYLPQTPAAVAAADGVEPFAAAEDPGALFCDVRHLVAASRPRSEEWTDLHRWLALVHDQAGDAVARGDLSRLQEIFRRLWAWASRQPRPRREPFRAKKESVEVNYNTAGDNEVQQGFAGWVRYGREPWQKVCTAPTSRECWTELGRWSQKHRQRHIDLLVTLINRNPNENRR